ncbi:hypothetical protein VKT23_017398 [Stygiomarasmius scandens]|uniref:Sulfotransferase n=1 Tax=Marasmiellus scandens TaxID=2682957 RepID=A0ABR1IV90_9AGAR
MDWHVALDDYFQCSMTETASQVFRDVKTIVIERQSPALETSLLSFVFSIPRGGSSTILAAMMMTRESPFAHLWNTNYSASIEDNRIIRDLLSEPLESTNRFNLEIGLDELKRERGTIQDTKPSPLDSPTLFRNSVWANFDGRV